MSATPTILPIASNATAKPGYELHISRVFSAPRELVFRAFTEPAMIAEWMGPVGFEAKDIAYDVRPGGSWRVRLHKAGEATACDPGVAIDLWMGGDYLEVDPPQRLVFTFTWENRSDIPKEVTTCTVVFRELEGKTVMDLTQGNFGTVEARNAHNVGWSSAFDKFADYVLSASESSPKASKPTYDLVIERTFDAPRDLVWKCWTDTDMAKQWAGPRGFSATHFEQDPRPGGKWRICLHTDSFDPGDGVPRAYDLWQGGTFKEIVDRERVVYTFAWDDPMDVGLNMPHHETLITVEFRDLGGEKTAMTFRQDFFLSEGEAKGHKGGWSSGFEKLAELIAAQKAQA